MFYDFCSLCPRECRVDRTAGKLGFCGCPDIAIVSKTMLHGWEEPVLAPNGCSGAIFFAGCTLRCSYCQNKDISQKVKGSPVRGTLLRTIMEDLIGQGAENIDLITPTQYVPTIAEALEKPLPVPVIYNCGGYERPEILELLRGKVDVFLPDFKYSDDSLAKKLSGAENYFAIAKDAIRKMYDLVGDPEYEGGKLVKGVIVRHLILPGHVDNSLKVLDTLGEMFKPGQILVSLMRQYTPMPGMVPPLDRPITDEEYDAVLSWMYLNNLEGFTQGKASSNQAYIPDFSIF